MSRTSAKTLRSRGEGAWLLAAFAALLCSFLLVSALFAPAFADEKQDDAAAANEQAGFSVASLADGAYTIEVTMTGGSGKASVESPCALAVEGGKAYATLVWSSENYDYMLVNGEKVTPITQKPTSQFKVEVLKFDEPYEMVGDTTAMGTPHEITYSFTFDSSTIKEDPNAKQTNKDSSKGEKAGKALDKDQIMLAVTVGSGAVAAIAIGLTIGILRGYRQRR